MDKTAALLLQYLPYILKAASTVPQVVDYLEKMRDHFRQTREWTPDQEAEFNRELDAITSQEHWRPKT